MNISVHTGLLLNKQHPSDRGTFQALIKPLLSYEKNITGWEKLLQIFTKRVTIEKQRFALQDIESIGLNINA